MANPYGGVRGQSIGLGPYKYVYESTPSTGGNSAGGRLGASRLRRKYRMMPDPKRVVIWRENSDDEIAAMQVVDFAEKRWPGRSGRPSSNKPAIQADLEVHLWTEELKGWEPEEYDKLVIVEDGIERAWVVGNVRDELLGSRYRLSCNKSRTNEVIRDAINAAISAS